MGTTKSKYTLYYKILFFKQVCVCFHITKKKHFYIKPLKAYEKAVLIMPALLKKIKTKQDSIITLPEILFQPLISYISCNFTYLTQHLSELN